MQIKFGKSNLERCNNNGVFLRPVEQILCFGFGLRSILYCRLRYDVSIVKQVVVVLMEDHDVGVF